MADVYITVSGAGNKDGTSWGDAYDASQIQNFVDDITSGFTGWMEEGTYTLSSPIDIDINAGTISDPIEWVGVNSSHVEDGTRPILDGNSAVDYCIKISGSRNFWHLRNLELRNANNHGFFNSDNWSNLWIITNIVSINHGGSGINGSLILGGIIINSCDFSGNTTFGLQNITTNTESILSYSKVMNNGDTGTIGPKNILNCIIHNNNGAGVSLGNVANVVKDNVIDGNASHGVSNAINGSIVINNRITHNGGYGVLSGTDKQMYENNNGFYNNSSGEVSGNALFSGPHSLSLTSDGYWDRANDNFSLSTDGEGVGVEFPIGGYDSTNLGYLTQGIPPEYVVDTSEKIFIIGIPSAESFGYPNVSSNVIVPQSIVTAESFGLPKIILHIRSDFQSLMEEDLEDGIFGEDEEFTVLATYTYSDGESFELLVIYDKNYQEVDPDTGAVVQSRHPMITCQSSKFRKRPGKGDKINIQGVNYEVITNEPDGTGVSELTLHQEKTV